MTITYGSRFTSLPNWSSSLDAFTRVQFNDAFTNLNTNAAGWTESTSAASGTVGGFFHYNSTDKTLKVYSTGDTAWVTIRSGYEIHATGVNAQGDLIAGTANNVVSRVGVGTNGQVLTADSGESTGLLWSNAVLSVAGTANEVESSLVSGVVTVGLPDDVTIAGTLTVDSVGIAAVQSSVEAFADNDTSVMTSAAIQDKILAYSYATDANLTINNVRVRDVEVQFHMEVTV